jgi:hypothetical protein
MELSTVVASWLAARDSADGEDLRRFDDV